MPLDNLILANDEPRIDYFMVAQVRQLESVRPGLFLHLIGIFDKNMTALLAEAPQKMADNEIESLRVSFHSLKGTAASLGAQRLGYIAGIAEKAIVDNLPKQSLESIVEHLSIEFEATRDALLKAAREP